jgi:hypothetical protein
MKYSDVSQESQLNKSNNYFRGRPFKDKTDEVNG